MEKKYRSIYELKNWEENPKEISTEGLLRVMQQVKTLGQYKPLLITPDGTVIGGNSRLRAYRALLDKARQDGDEATFAKYQTLWVSEVDFVQDGSLWYAVLDGERQEKTFSRKETGMHEYGLSDNDEPGAYVKEKLDKAVEQYEIDTSGYGVSFAESILLADIGDEPPEPAPKEPKEPKDQEPPEVKCPECGHKFQPE